MTSGDRTSSTTAAGISFVQYARVRAGIRDRWPSFFALPVVTDPLLHLPADTRSLLDVGATDRLWEPRVRERFPGVDYRSLDVDRTRKHDYHAFEDVDRTFDVVLCLEVLEHVPPPTALDLVRRCAAFCRPGGIFVASVPNTLHAYTALEFTHVTHYAYYDLGGVLEWGGFRVERMMRWYIGPRRGLIVRRAFSYLFRLLRIDYCPSVLAVARPRPEPAVAPAAPPPRN